MITNKRDLQEYLSTEKVKYCDYQFQNKSRYFISKVKQEPIRMIWEWQKTSRKKDYFRYKARIKKNLWYSFQYLIYTIRCNRLASRMSMEVGTENIDKGLMIFHFNNVVNNYSVIGENCHLHGDNVIGNNGKDSKDCPIIGNNVCLGAGAKVIGKVFLADNITVGAGAVVVKSCLTKGATLVGIPAKELIK